MRPLLRTGSLGGRPVVIGDVRLGAVVDVLFDRALARLVGLQVLCGDGARRFLPFPACEVCENRIAVESALVLLDRELDVYRTGGRTHSDLRGRPVTVAGNEVGSLADQLVGGEGNVTRILVSAPGGEVELEPGPDVVVGNDALRPAV
jgi:uncharacterized protein YrrD